MKVSSSDTRSAFDSIMTVILSALFLCGIDLQVFGYRVAILYAHFIKLVILGSVFSCYILSFAYVVSDDMQVTKVTQICGGLFNMTKFLLFYLNFILRKQKFQRFLQEANNVFMEILDDDKIQCRKLRFGASLGFIFTSIMGLSSILPVLITVITQDRRGALYPNNSLDHFNKAILMVTTFLYLFGMYFYLLVGFVIIQLFRHFRQQLSSTMRTKRHFTSTVSIISTTGRHVWEMKPVASSSFRLHLLKRHQNLCRLVDTMESLFREAIAISSLVEITHLVFLLRSIDFTRPIASGKFHLPVVFVYVVICFFAKLTCGAIINSQVSLSGSNSTKNGNIEGFITH